MPNRDESKDSFVFDNMPHKDEWPAFIHYDVLLDKRQFNCAEELIDRAVEEGFGDKVAIYSPTEQWTYKELLARSNQIANVLVKDCGIIPGNRVLLRSSNNPMLVACWLAIIKVGGVAVTTISMLRAQEISTIANQSKARFALCDERLKQEMEKAVTESADFNVLYFNCAYLGSMDLESRMSTQSTEFINFQTDGSDIALIGFTSGTTGKPKGALHSHFAVLAVCETFSKQVVKPTADDIFSGTPPIGFVYGLGGLLLFPLHARASTVLLEDVRPDSLIDAIHQFHISVLYTAPTAYKAMLEHDVPKKLHSLKKGVSAGEALPAYVSDWWLKEKGIRLIDGIGSTEMLHIFVSVQNADDPLGTLGKAVPGYEARVIDKQGKELKVGEVGLLAVRGPTGCRYLNDERQKDYVVNGWNVTGDTAKIDENGFFWYQARIDGMIISSGYNIAAPDVEQTVAQHPAVAECAVIGIPDKERGHLVRAYIVLKEGFAESDALIKDIQDFAKQQSSPYKYPRSIKFIGALPRTLTGKVQHFMLRKMAKSDF